MNVRHEVMPYVVIAVIVGIIVSLLLVLGKVSGYKAAGIGMGIALFFSFYFLYFFRDPERTAPADDKVVVSGADGVIAGIKEMREDRHLKTDTVRISIFLSLFDVHVNRAPIAGKARFLGYFPGKHIFTFKEKSSDVNQHNEIMIAGRTKCLVYQIVGPVARRVVYWPDNNNEVELKMGDRIGMMKFGSRMDIYLPNSDVTVLVREGDVVRAGETVIARLNK